MTDGSSLCQYVAAMANGPTGLIFGETVVTAGKLGRLVAIEVESA